MRITDFRKLGFIGDFLPRKCGIATFTSDLSGAVASQYPSLECCVASVNDIPDGYDYPSQVQFEFAQQDLDSYRGAADFLNFSNVDLVSLQHEYGIFGGPAGGYILALLRDLRMPVVTTLHTVLREPSRDQRRVMCELAELSTRLVVMSRRGQEFLRNIYGLQHDKIDVIAHGIPDMPFVDPNLSKERFGVEGRAVMLTFGLLSPNKGIEYALEALPGIIQCFPNFVYIVLGATHPNLVREQGETYRLSLERKASDLGVRKNVIFYNRFVERRELIEFIAAADIYLTPYLDPAQITSGTLAYAFGCGKPVISTPYWHAEELLVDGQGTLVPFKDSAAITASVCALLQDEPKRRNMAKRAYGLGREMIWSHVAHLYMSSFERARRVVLDRRLKPLAIQTLDERPWELPKWRLEHLIRMTDSTGLLQHAKYTLPNLSEGYCTDDNARALRFVVHLEELELDTPEIQRLTTRYAAFVDAAFDPQRGRFRNFMTFDRQWVREDDLGSDDCFGRALWALGAFVARSKRSGLRAWAMDLFLRALPASLEMRSPRAWASALIGIDEYLSKLSGDPGVLQIQAALLSNLMGLHEQIATNDWPWFEPGLSYENALLPHALILSGHRRDENAVLQIGLRTLGWLTTQQRAPRGHFRPIGSNGFYEQNSERADFDQQPIEACATIAASIAAYRVTEHPAWLNEARLAFEWFLGRNDLAAQVYDPSSGGCHDGLHADRVNENQGAESTLAFLLSLAELSQLESSLAAFRQTAEVPAGVSNGAPHQ